LRVNLDWISRLMSQFGSYQIEQKYIVQMDQLREQLKSERAKNKALENNQKRQQKFPDGGLVYALEPMGLILKKKGKKTIRIGKSVRMQNRWSTHNTSVPDNFKLVYSVEVDDPADVEKCVHLMLHKCIYWDKKKSYYICTKAEIKRVFDGCAELIQTGHFPQKCGGCKKTMDSLDTLITHAKNKHENNLLIGSAYEAQIGGTVPDINEIESLDLSVTYDQFGGTEYNPDINEIELSVLFVTHDQIDMDHMESTQTDTDYYYGKYLKYKQKYLYLKMTNSFG
jgi:hypothetical protein